MQFAPSPAANRMPSVMPLLGVSLFGAALVLAMACFSLCREEETIRLPAGTLPRPPTVRERPAISVRLSRQGAVMLASQAMAEGDLAKAWQRERGAVRLLGFEPSQATVVIRTDADVPTEKVQRLMEQAEEAGFSRCVLRSAEQSPDPRGTPSGFLDQEWHVPEPPAKGVPLRLPRPSPEAQGRATQTRGTQP